MRRFTDRDGNGWEIVAGRESWGTIVALFIPDDDEREVRQAPLSAVGYEAATSHLAGLSPDDIQELLDGSAPKTR